MALWTIEDVEGKEPSSWKVSLHSNIGTAEPFVQQLVQEMPRIVDFGRIMEPQRTRVKEAICIIGIEGLMPALNALRKIRALPNPDLPEMDRRQLYDDFGRTLWPAYKGLLPLAAVEIGFDIGFLFQNDANFEKKLRKFQASHPEPELPSGFGGYLREQRERWQNRLQRWRNECLEHPSLTGWENFKSLYEVSQAELFFESAWNAIVIILAALLQSKLWPGWALQEIPEAERDPNFPNRFRFVPPPNFPLNRQT